MSYNFSINLTPFIRNIQINKTTITAFVKINNNLLLFFPRLKVLIVVEIFKAIEASMKNNRLVIIRLVK